MYRLLAGTVVLTWAIALLGGPFRPAEVGPGAPPRPRPGYAAPPIAARNLEGRPVSLSELRGKAVFLNFWASWCGPCRLEMPEIQRLAGRLPPGTAILTVNATRTERSPDAAAAYLQQHGYTFPVVTDPDGRAVRDYEVISFPTSLFISPEGKVTARITGPLTQAAMLGYLKEAAGR